MTLRIRLGLDGHLYLDGATLADREQLKTLAQFAVALEYIHAACFTMIHKYGGKAGEWTEFEFNMDGIKAEPLWRFAWEHEWKPKSAALVLPESETVQ